MTRYVFCLALVFAFSTAAEAKSSGREVALKRIQSGCEERTKDDHEKFEDICFCISFKLDKAVPKLKDLELISGTYIEDEVAELEMQKPEHDALLEKDFFITEDCLKKFE